LDRAIRTEHAASIYDADDAEVFVV
jgi:hypothetical protein